MTNDSEQLTEAPRDQRDSEFYSRIGSKGGGTTNKRYGAAFYARIGSKGGSSTAERYGKAHFEAMGKRGGAKIRELVAAGRKAMEISE